MLYKIIGVPKKFKHQLRPLVRLSSLNFGQNFFNLSHETVPLNIKGGLDGESYLALKCSESVFSVKQFLRERRNAKDISLMLQVSRISLKS